MDAAFITSKLKKRRLWLIIVLVELAICILSGAIDAKMGGINENTDIVIENDGTFIVPRSGIYEMAINYSSDHDSCVLIVESDEGEESERVPLVSYRNSTSFRLYVKSGLKHTIYLDSSDDGSAEIESASIVFDTKKTGWRLGVSAAMLMVIIDIMMLTVCRYIGKSRREVLSGLGIIATLGMVVLICSIPLFQSDLFYGHDVMFHLRRIGSLADELENNSLSIIRLHHSWFNNYGYPVGIMYPDIMLYIPALLHNAGFSLTFVYKFYVFFTIVLTVLISYYSVKRVYGERRVAMTAAAIYSLSMWHLTDLYTRASLGEYTAIAFLPLVVAGFLVLIHGDKKEDHTFAMLGMILGYSGICQSHLLTFVSSILFGFLFMIFHIRTIIAEHKLFVIIKSIIYAVMLNLFFIVPMVDYYLNQPMVINTETSITKIQTLGICADNLMTMDYSTVLGMKEVGVPASQEMPQTPGISLLICAALSISVLLFYTIVRNKRDHQRILNIGLGVILSMLSLFMASAHMPYDYLADQMPSLYRLIGSVQYPVRYLTIFCVIAVFLIAGAMKDLITDYRLPTGSKGAHLYLYILCVAAIGMSTIQAGSYLEKFIKEQTNIVKADDLTALGYFNEDRQYFLTDTDVDRIVYRNLITSNDAIELSKAYYIKNGYKAIVQNPAGIEGYIELPAFAYKGYQAYSEDIYGNGARTKLEVVRGDNNKARILIPSDTNSSFTVYLEFKSMWYWILCDFISAYSLFYLIMLITRTIRSDK